MSARRAFDTTMVESARAVRIGDEIARRGIRLRGRGTERVGPCPKCGGDDRFSINVKKNIWHCRGCAKGGDVLDLVEHLDGGSFRNAVETLTGESPHWSVVGESAGRPEQTRRDDHGQHEERQHQKAAWLWSRRQPITGSIAEKYLREARGIACSLPPTLGFLPAYGEHAPALIAAFAIPAELEPGILSAPTSVGAIHLTLLAQDGTGKADARPNKIMVGAPGDLPIVIAPPNDLMGLAVTEGIEDALSVFEATGLGAWAAGSGARMPAIAEAVPAYIEAITIFAHADKTGQDGARGLAEILNRRGIEVFIEGLEP